MGNHDIKKIAVSVSLLCLVLLLAVSGYLYLDMQQQLSSPMNIQQATTYQIKQGASLQSIGNDIVKRDWLAHSYYLLYEGRRRNLAGSIKTGEYAIQPGLTPKQFLEDIVSGKVIQYSLTIPEGWTFKQLMHAIRNHPHLEQTLENQSQAYVMAALDQAGQHAEGRFFPDTYHFPTNTTDIDFLQRAYHMMVQVLTEEWEQRAFDLPYQTPYEALIMASLIEKETAVAEERTRIAGVFARRLEKNIKLQTDPTVIYAMGELFDGDIRYKDLEMDSPYNTYRYRGLPPTPIALPGRASIRAALQPQEGNELYFVATGDGKHHFSETLDEHNRAVAKYQMKKR